MAIELAVKPVHRVTRGDRRSVFANVNQAFSEDWSYKENVLTEEFALMSTYLFNGSDMTDPSDYEPFGTPSAGDTVNTVAGSGFSGFLSAGDSLTIDVFNNYYVLDISGTLDVTTFNENGFLDIAGGTVDVGGDYTAISDQLTGAGSTLSVGSTFTISYTSNTHTGFDFGLIGASGKWADVVLQGTMEVASKASVEFSGSIQFSAQTALIEVLTGSSVTFDDSLTIPSGEILVGFGVGAGTGSSATVDGDLALNGGSIGASGANQITVKGDLSLDKGGGAGIDGNSTLTVDGHMTVGDAAAGTFVVASGGQATVALELLLGNSANGQGTLTVDGSGVSASKLTTQSSVVIGLDGTATVTVSGGADFDASASAVSLLANTNANSLNINGAGSTMEAGSLGVGSTDVGLAMVGVDAGRLTISGNLTLGTQLLGELQVSDKGTLIVNGNIQDGGLNGSTLGDLQILSGSNFQWNGTFSIADPNTSTTLVSQLLISGGSTAAPVGGTSQGSISVNGNALILVEGTGSKLSVQSLVLSNDCAVTTDSQGVIIVGGTSGGGATTAAPGTVLVNPFGSITGIGELTSITIVDNGTIESRNPSAAGSSLALNATTVAGTGQVLIDTDTTMVVNATDTTLAMTFNGAPATLELRQPSQFNALIAGLQGGDVIQLDDMTVDSVDLNAALGTLQIMTSTGVNLTYNVAGNFNGVQFDIDNSNGNAVLTLEPGAPSPPLGPIINAGNPSATFVVNHAPAMLDSGLTVSDGESGTLIGATVSISGGTFVNDGDVLSVDTAGTAIAASYDSVDETLTLSGTATVAQYQALLQKVAFNSTAQDPTDGGADTSRTITWTVTDGIGSSSPVTTTINVESLLDEIYLAILQRVPSSAEVAVAMALQVAVSTAGVIASIVDSPEAQHNVYPIAQNILLATGSLPTASQLAGWVPFVESAGVLQGNLQSNPLLDQMAEAFVASTAFGNTYNGGTAVDPNSPITGSVVSAIIQAATGIAATQPQINAWLATGQTIDQVFVDFALGDQYTAHIQNAVQKYLATAADTAIGGGGLGVVNTTPNDGLSAAQVQGAYQAVLQRAPTSAEVNGALSIDATIGNVGAIAALVDGTEAQQYVYPVTQIILLATGNVPTPAQLAGWVPAVETGTSLDTMALAFVASTAFGNTYNGGTAVDPNAPIATGIVSAIIDAATGIAATQTQVNAWLATGETIDQVFVSFALGDQYSAHIQGTVQAYLDAAAINAAGLTTVDGINATGALTLGTAATPLTGNNLSILGGLGSLSVVASGNGDTVTELSTSTAGGTITASGSNDTINLANGANTITLTGDLTGATTQNGTTTNGIAMTTLGNVVDGSGDQIIFNNATTEVLAGTGGVNVTSAGSLAQALDMAAAAAAASQTGGKIAANTGAIDWFQYNNNTYIVEAINNTGSSANHSVLAATDEVIKIVGLVSLSGESLATHTLTL
jgi:T5SS/PEP-CTERM-associated repeat protein